MDMRVPPGGVPPSRGSWGFLSSAIEGFRGAQKGGEKRPEKEASRVPRTVVLFYLLEGVGSKGERNVVSAYFGAIYTERSGAQKQTPDGQAARRVLDRDFVVRRAFFRA